MKSLTNKIYNTIFLFGLLLILTVSCEKSFDTTVNLPRPFTPTRVNASNGDTSVVISWPASLFATGKNVTYTVEVSKDMTFQGTIDQTITTDTTTIVLKDDVLTVKETYYARVKAVNSSGVSSNNWVYSEAFMITGEQIFFPILDAELKDKSVILRWKPTAGLTKIVVTPTGGSSFDVTLDATDVAAAFKQITGLTASTEYTAEIFRGAVTKGTLVFTTKVPSIFTTTITTADNLVDVVAAANDGDVIGLEPGVYDCVDGGGTYTNLQIIEKTITLQSVSGNPDNTKVNYKEITLKGNGAGLTFKDLEFDGAPSSTAGQSALYFINLTGLNSDSEPAVFTDIIVENCIVHDMGNTYMRGNRGSGSNGDHKVGTIRLNNSIVYNSAQINTNYSFFQINRLEFQTLEVTNSTLYSIGRAFVDWDANFTVNPRPVIFIDQVTINNFGLAGMSNILFDVNANDVDVTMQNSIFGNAPYPGQTVSSLIRASNALMTIKNCNYFNLTDGAPAPAPLTFPASVNLSANQEIDLGWTDATTDFSLPGGSPLRTAGTTGGPIGDLRWAF